MKPGGLRWNGVTNGFRTFADYHSDQDLHVIFAGNLMTGAVDLVRTMVPRVAQGKPVEPGRVPAVQPVVIDGLDRVLPPGHLIAQTLGRYPVRVRYLAPIEPPFGSGVRRDVVRELGDRVRNALIEELARMRAERA